VLHKNKLEIGGAALRYTIFRTWRLPWRQVVILLVVAAAAVGGVNLYQNQQQQGLPATSWAVANKILVIDPGHGGADPGAVGPGGTLEKDLTLAIGQKLAQQFLRAGAVVIMTREDDRDLAAPGEGTRKKRDLDARLDIIQKHGGEIFIGVQANATPGSRWRGAQTFYKKDPENEALAKSIQAELKRVLQNTTREALPLNPPPYILQQLEIPAVMVEVGFLSNPEEERLLNDPVYQDKMAGAIYAGVVNYLTQQDKASSAVN